MKLKINYKRIGRYIRNTVSVLGVVVFAFAPLSEIVAPLPLPEPVKELARNVLPQTPKANAAPVFTYLATTTSSPWNVPADWNDSNNMIIAIGAGGRGGTFTQGGGGGGGGAWASVSNINLNPDVDADFQVGAGLSTKNSIGHTWFCDRTTDCTSLTDLSVTISAASGSSGISTAITAGAGGTTIGSASTAEFAGGAGGAGNSGGADSGGGGGGAGSQYGTGGTGGAGAPNGGEEASGGGGGSGDDSGTGDNGTAGGVNGGAGGDSVGNSSSGGAGGTDASGTAGTDGGGGGGADDPIGETNHGGRGGDGEEFEGTEGSGGGGGGADDDTAGVRGGIGGYAGGGGGGGVTPGYGGDGIIVIRYEPLVITASAENNQTSTFQQNSTDKDMGSLFSFTTTGSASVRTITLTEGGTIDAQTNLDNIKLYYENDTSVPYDCLSESLSSPTSPTESQFGSTDTDGFSAANGTATFSGVNVIQTDSSMCVYTVLDVGGATVGDTIELSISATSDFTVGTGTKALTGGAMSGTTTVIAAASTFTQSGFRFFENSNATQIGGPLANINASASVPNQTGDFRLRMLIHVGTANLDAGGQDFTLQTARKGNGTCAVPQFSYVEVTTTSSISYNDNPGGSVTDGATMQSNGLDPTHSSDTKRSQTYEEANDFTNSVQGINSGEDGLWDFSLKEKAGLTDNQAFCFRIVKADDTTLTTYNNFPEIFTFNTAQIPGQAIARHSGGGGSSDGGSGGGSGGGGGSAGGGGGGSSDGGSGGGSGGGGGSAGGGGGGAAPILFVLVPLWMLN